MTVKRITDPAGILPDRVIIKNDGAGIDKDTFIKMLMASTPQARIAQLTRHKELEDIATHLKSKLVDGNANLMLLMEISDAEKKALYLDVAPRVIRDNKRQAGTKKDRKPEINQWIENKLRHNPSLTAQELWDIAPKNIDNNISINSIDDDGIGIDAFKKRITKIRKKIKNAASN